MNAPPINIGAITGTFTPTPGARLSSTIRPQLGQSSKPFKCLTSEVDALKPALYSADPLNRGFFYTAFDKVDEVGLLSEVNMISEGVLNRVLPQPFYRNNFSIQSVTTNATAVSTGDKVTMTILYRAPSTSYEWLEDSLPSDYPRYSSMQTSANPLDPKNLIRIQTTSTDTGLPNFVSYADFIAAWNSLAVQLQVSEYEPNLMIPGLYWSCRSTVTMMVIGATG